jgi:hypothetical protein
MAPAWVRQISRQNSSFLLQLPLTNAVVFDISVQRHEKKKNLRVCLFRSVPFSAIAGLLSPAGLLLQECRKDNDAPDKMYLDKITILHNRIINLSHYEGNTLLIKSEYIFRDASVTFISTNNLQDTIPKVVNKIGENGYAESSKAYPEHTLFL